MDAPPLPEFQIDKHGYVQFDCSSCTRKAKLQLQVVRSYLGSKGLDGIVGMMARPDCRELPCGFRFRLPG